MIKLLTTLLLSVGVASAQHPKLIFDATDWARIQASATANSTDWQNVKAICDYFLDSQVRYPAILGTPGSSVVVPGTTGTLYDGRIGDAGDYQGGQYAMAVLTLGACYRGLLPSNPTAARVYSAKAREIIPAITDPPVWMFNTVNGKTIPLAIRAKAGQPYDNTTIGWDAGALFQAYAKPGDTVVISNSRGCTNINGTWTVLDTHQTLTFVGTPLAEADCNNYSWSYSNDNNYGLRNYGSALSLLYDWFYPELTVDEKSKLTVGMTNLLTQNIANGYGMYQGLSTHPENNYAGGFMMATVTCDAAWSGDNATLSDLCHTKWTEIFSSQYMLHDYYEKWMYGGGDGEGLSAYGQGTIARIVESEMTMRNLGIDVLQPPYTFNFCDEQAQFMLKASKPDRISLGEMDYITFNIAAKPSNPTFLDPEMMYKLNWCASRQGSSYAPYLHSLLDYTLANQNLVPLPLGKDFYPTFRFLFYDASAPVADPTTLPLSYRGYGGDYLMSRSGWASNSVSVEFQGGTSKGSSGNGKPQFMSGAFAVWNGPDPFVVFGMGERARSVDILTDVDAGNLQNERLGYNNRKDSIFAADRPGSNFIKLQGLPLIVHPPGNNIDVPSFPNKLDRTEDTGTYVYGRSVGLEANYPTSLIDVQAHVQLWTRELIYIRPKLVVVHDITATKYADDDRSMFWTFGRDLAQVADPAAGQHRFHSTRGATFKGALTTVLPTASLVPIVDHGIVSVVGTGVDRTAVLGTPLHFLYRVEQRPTAMDHTNDNWLSVADAASSIGAVESITSLTATNADVIQLSTSGVVGFANGTLPFSYTFTGTPNHLISGLTPLTSYHRAISSSTATISAPTGSGDIVSSAAGVLTFTSTVTIPSITVGTQLSGKSRSNGKVTVH